MLIDSHCHLASHRFDAAEVPTLIERAKAAGVARLVTLSTSLGDLGANLHIAGDPAVHACLGIHPCDVHHAPDDAVDQIGKHIADPRVCAIGETGLDYYHPAPDGWQESAFRERQRHFLRLHFELASQSGLHVVIHTRDRVGCDSFEDALSIYQEFSERTRAVFHCFIGTPEHARRVLDLGGLLSFGGVATFKNARALRDTVISCPAGSFMLETDAPYLAPEPHRGKRNEPSYVRNTAECIAAQRGEDVDQLLRHTGAAAERFFRFRSLGN